MRRFVITIALAGLVVPAVMADPAPTQTPAQLEQSAPAAPAPGLTSQKNKAAAKQDSKAQATAQLAAKKPLDSGAAAKTSTSTSAEVANGHDDQAGQ